MFRAIGSLFIVPTAVLLTLSFFVLVVNQKQEKLLKLLGWAVAVLLWFGAFMVFSAGNYVANNGYGKMLELQKSMMPCPMMKDGGMPCKTAKVTGEQGTTIKRVTKRSIPMHHNTKTRTKYRHSK